MSAIAGFLQTSGAPLSSSALPAMMSRLDPRGSDDRDLWRRGPAGLAAWKRWTTPESIYAPAITRRGALTLAADARIDNRDDLIRRLVEENRSPDAIGDDELILRAYERWGESCPERLEGDFAFAVWDEAEQTLFCARDCFGVKPFYYHHGDTFFAFASEIKALLVLPGVPRRPDEFQIACFLLPCFDDATGTIYDGIRRLPPAHSIRIARSASHHASWMPHHRRYWSLDPVSERTLPTDDAYAGAFRELFMNAVRCRLRSREPAGTLLSGGLDSSSITCAARLILGEAGAGPVETFSAVFPNTPRCDERSYIDAAANLEGMSPHYLEADGLHPLSSAEETIQSFDGPINAVNLFMHDGLFRLARESGVGVLLDGFDGDTTVSHGLEYLRVMARSGRWLPLIRELRGFTRHFDRPFLPAAHRYLWRDGLLERHPRLILFEKASRRVSRLAKRSSAPSHPPSLLRADFARRINLRDRLVSLKEDDSIRSRTERASHARRLGWGIIPYAMEVVDAVAARRGIEPRYPFFDRRLAEFCVSLPPTQKIRDGWTRYVLRRAMEGILPPAIQWRGGKQNLSDNFVQGLLRRDANLLQRHLERSGGIIDEMIDRNVLRETFARARATETEPDALILWRAAVLSMWLESAGFD